MGEDTDPLVTFWDMLLSREPGLIQQVFSGLDEVERRSILAHLERMAGEPGWQPEQRASARAALAALKQVS
jgi:hypothetical protein